MNKRIELELSIIGTLVSSFWVDEKAKYLGDKCLSYALQRLQPKFFQKEEHREIFKHLANRVNQGKTRQEAIETLPEKLRDYCCYAEEFELYDFDRFKGVVEALVEKWIEEERESIGIKLQSGDLTEEEAVQALSELDKFRRPKNRSAEEVVVSILNKLAEEKKEKEFFTHIPGFDPYVSFMPGEVVLIGARPGHGKTSLAVAMSYKQMTLQNAKVLFFSMELPAERLIERYISYLSGVPAKRIRSGFAKEEEIDRFLEAADQVAQLPLEIYDEVNLTIPKFKAKVLEVKPDIVYIDYVQRFVQHKRYNSIREFLNEVSIELTNVAKQFGIPVVGLAQLSREAEKAKEDEMPKMSHLKETGQLEQDASIIFVMHLNKKLTPYQLKIACVKNRDGEIPPSVSLTFKNGFPVFNEEEEKVPVPPFNPKEIDEIVEDEFGSIEF